MKNLNRLYRNVGRIVALGAVAGLAGCVIFMLIVVGLEVGVWLDGQLGRPPLFTVILVLLSTLVGLLVSVRLALSAARWIQSGAGETPPKPKEEKNT
jgi:F0F1-type ATP synthase assembly protein I